MIDFLFYLFALVLLVSGFKVITAHNTVHSVLYLVLAFFNAACLWMLLQAEFLAIVLIMVYVGAVMVLFLFVVMMLDVKNPEGEGSLWQHFPLAAFVGVLIAVEMSLVLMGGFKGSEVAVNPAYAGIPNTKLLGIEIYTHYLYPLELAAVLLLVGIVAAIALTLREGGSKDSKAMEPGLQVRVKKADRLRIHQVAAFKPAVRVVASEIEPAAADAAAAASVVAANKGAA